MRIGGYKKFHYTQLDEETKRIMQIGSVHDTDWINWLKREPIYWISERGFHFLVNIDNEKFDNDVKRLATGIVETGIVDITELQAPSIPEEFPTGEGRAWKPYREGDEALRRAAIQIYKQCALCDISDHDLLVPAHIVGWAGFPGDRGKTNNIICMCIIHHKLFEWHKLTILDDYTVEFSKQFLEARKHSTMYDMIKTLTGNKIKLPSDERHIPIPNIYMHTTDDFTNII